MARISTLSFLGASLFVAGLVLAEEPKATPADNSVEPKPVSYHRDVFPILRANCLGCHQGAKHRGDYVMTQFDQLLSGGESGEAAIVPGNADASLLVTQITPVDGHAEMPDEPAKPLADTEIQLIRRWISEGASNDSPVQAIPFDNDNPPVYRNPPTLTSIDVSADGNWIAAAGHHEVILIDAHSGERKQRLIGSSPRLNSIKFSPDSTRLACAGGSPAVAGEIQVWNVASGKLELSTSVTFDTLRGVRWSPDGKQISFGGGDNTLRAIDSVTGEQLLFQGAHEDWVLDTVYTVDGTHLISVARDMTCKLTEVATERFVDNITSITPGALSGGLNSVERHPLRDELLLGGADGVAKIYRVFRDTQRRIGDDANLIRQMPAMPGRIFAVAISPDGSQFAAAAELDGNSEVRVWDYDFDGTLPADIKRISGRAVGELSEDDKQQLADFRNQPVPQRWRSEIPGVAVYSLRFAPDASLLVAATDGLIRHFDTVGQEIRTIEVIDAESIQPLSNADLAFDPRAWLHDQANSVDTASEPLQPVDQIVSLRVTPDEVMLDGPLAYNQMIIAATLVDGSNVDVTRAAEWQLPSFATVTASGVVRPLSDGQGAATARFGKHEVVIKIDARSVTQNYDSGSVDIDFIRDVNPVLSRLGCNQGTCHGAQAGKNGFKLSLRGYDPIFDVRALTDDHAARRINAANPDDSLMLLKPLGLAPHQGGTLMKNSDPYYAVLQRWIADGCQLRLESPRVTGIEIAPVNPVVSQLGGRQQVRIVAHYADGHSRDVTSEAFVTSGNTEVAEASTAGLLTAVRRGEAPILARYEGSYAATTMTVMGKRDDFQWDTPPVWNRIDELVSEKWQRMKIRPSGLCSDEEFLRRVTLDLTGLPPTSQAIREFMADPNDTQWKRSLVIDSLIASDEYVEFWTNKWADLLQVNRKFLGVEGSAAYRQWIRESVLSNQPYDEFARAILTAMGSNKTNPPASYFKVLRTPEETMENTTHLFLGIRFNCNKCHDHPFERWTQDQYYETAAFFTRTSLRADPAGGKEMIGGSAVDGAKPLYEEVYESPTGEMKHLRTSKEVDPKFPYKVDHDTADDANRRDQLAAWMTDADNPYFARSYVNRLWGYMTGVGLIEPIDDIRAGNPPTNPELLNHLTTSFVDSGFDRRHMLRMICNSRTYQLSVKTNRWNNDDTQNYSHALPRRLPAEVLFDTVHFATGSAPNIPGVPKGTRAAELPDAGVKLDDGFLQSLGKPVRESACECERSSDLQLGPVMSLVSGPTVGRAISDPNNDIRRSVESIDDDGKLVEELFLRLLGRLPRDAEVESFAALRNDIRENHESLKSAMGEREAWWNTELPQRETAHAETIAVAESMLATAIELAKPEQGRLSQERDKRIAVAENEVNAEKQKLVEKLPAWEKSQTDNIEWFPAVPVRMSATSNDKIHGREDRSLVVSGGGEKGIYELTFETSLRDITGIRLEALARDPDQGVGPGLASNGNFVLTELEIEVANRKNNKEKQPVAIGRGVADFTQDGFSAEAVFDGRPRDQQGWAVSGSSNYSHWIVLQTKEPISLGDDKRLVLRLNQFHNAEQHRLARFRISFTTSTAPEIGLGLAENYRAIVTTPAAERSDQDKLLLSNYFESIDPALRDASRKLAESNAPVPPDPEVIVAKKRLERAQQPIVTDATLVGLRTDSEQSDIQVNQERLTAAEDLVWALINSPEFLFNR